jgi:ribosomal protein L16/L10AE
MLQPMRTKFRKAHKGRIKGLATAGIDLAFGQFGLKALGLAAAKLPIKTRFIERIAE